MAGPGRRTDGRRRRAGWPAQPMTRGRATSSRR